MSNAAIYKGIGEVFMIKKKKSVIGRLFYTFGTLFFATVVAVCVMNYAKDGRAFQASLLSAIAGASESKDTTGKTKTSEDYKTIKYSKSNSKTTSKSSSKTVSKPSSDSKSSNDKGTAASDTKTPPVTADP